MKQKPKTVFLIFESFQMYKDKPELWDDLIGVYKTKADAERRIKDFDEPETLKIQEWVVQER